MASETKVQAFIHALEEGGWVGIIRTVLLLAAVASVYVIVILTQFKGLSHEKGMDQAQIARQIAAGRGFTTRFIRPMAYNQLSQHLGGFPHGDTPDTYNAPLNPYVESLIMRLTRKNWEMSEKDLVYINDRAIAGVALLFFIVSVGISYLTMKRLFDRRLALVSMGLILVCDSFWAYSLTGLPQMLMLLIFSAVTYCLVRAIENRKAEKNALLWLGLSGFGFGLLVLAHGLAIWIFTGALVYMAFAFFPRSGVWWMRALLHPAWIPLVIVLGMEGPWLLRLYKLTGNPFGTALFSGYGQLLGSESQIMRCLTLDTNDLTFSWFRSKVQGLAIAQISNIYSYLGHSPVAPIFFVSLMHLYKRPETASFRWCIFWMWLFALLGMSLFGLAETGSLHANDLHVLFVPMTLAYGMAFILVLWSRLAVDRSEVNLRIVRWSAYIALLLLSGFPLIYMLITGGRLPIQWPPYYPGSITQLGQWTNSDEIIASDMPWAVAWYADRRSVWLPDTIAHYMDMSDYTRLNGPIVGLYLTPVSSDSRFISDIEKGEYKEWAPFILRNLNTRGFPLQAATALQIGGECIFYSDRNRWNPRTE